MPVTVLGGGGADGKTTLLGLLAQQSALKKQPIVVDANPDQNAMEFDGVPSEIIAQVPEICNHWKKIVS